MPDMDRIEIPPIPSRAKSPPLNPSSTSLKWSRSKCHFDVFNSEVDTPPPRPSQKQEEDLVGESHDSMDEDEVSTDKTLSDDDDDDDCELESQGHE